MKRSARFLSQCCCLFAVLGLTLAMRENAQAADRVRVGVPSRSALWWPLYVAQERKFYQAEGLAVETVLVQAGAARAMQILTAGDLDFVAAGTISALTGYGKGSRIVMVSGLIEKSPFQLIAPPEIQSVKELKGKAIASGALGGPPHYVATVILRASGLDPRRDVQQYNIAGGNNRILALMQKQVYAAVLPPPFSFAALDMGLKIIANPRDFIPDDQNDGITTTKEQIDKNPEGVRKFVRAVAGGVRFIAAHREESIKILEKYTQDPKPVLEKSYDYLLPTISERINEKGVEALGRYLNDAGAINDAGVWKGFLDLRFLPSRP
jgi:NitT/TauT family transport system substrate-binding protein